MSDQPIVLRFVTSSAWVSGVIRRGELGFWASHVECLTPDGMLLGAHEDGFVRRPRNYDAGQWSRELYVTLPATPEQQAAFWAAVDALAGVPYDMEAIRAMAVGELTGVATLADNARASLICSAAMMVGLLASGHAKSAPASIRLTTPRDVLTVCAAHAAIGTPRKPGELARVESAFDPFAA